MIIERTQVAIVRLRRFLLDWLRGLRWLRWLSLVALVAISKAKRDVSM